MSYRQRRRNSFPYSSFFFFGSILAPTEICMCKNSTIFKVRNICHILSVVGAIYFVQSVFFTCLQNFPQSSMHTQVGPALLNIRNPQSDINLKFEIQVAFNLMPLPRILQHIFKLHGFIHVSQIELAEFYPREVW